MESLNKTNEMVNEKDLENFLSVKSKCKRMRTSKTIYKKTIPEKKNNDLRSLVIMAYIQEMQLMLLHLIFFCLNQPKIDSLG